MPGKQQGVLVINCFVPRLCLAGWIYEIKASFGLLKEILEGKKNELSPLSKIPPFFFQNSFRSKGALRCSGNLARRHPVGSGAGWFQSVFSLAPPAHKSGG
jgi:hypothetical protein